MNHLTFLCISENALGAIVRQKSKYSISQVVRIERDRTLDGSLPDLCNAHGRRRRDRRYYTHRTHRQDVADATFSLLFAPKRWTKRSATTSSQAACNIEQIRRASTSRPPPGGRSAPVRAPPPRAIPTLLHKPPVPIPEPKNTVPVTKSAQNDAISQNSTWSAKGHKDVQKALDVYVKRAAEQKRWADEQKRIKEESLQKELRKSREAALILEEKRAAAERLRRLSAARELQERQRLAEKKEREAQERWIKSRDYVRERLITTQKVMKAEISRHFTDVAFAHVRPFRERRLQLESIFDDNQRALRHIDQEVKNKIEAAQKLMLEKAKRWRRDTKSLDEDYGTTGITNRFDMFSNVVALCEGALKDSRDLIELILTSHGLLHEAFPALKEERQLSLTYKMFFWNIKCEALPSPRQRLAAALYWSYMTHNDIENAISHAGHIHRAYVRILTIAKHADECAEAHSRATMMYIEATSLHQVARSTIPLITALNVLAARRILQKRTAKLRVRKIAGRRAIGNQSIFDMDLAEASRTRANSILTDVEEFSRNGLCHLLRAPRHWIWHEWVNRTRNVVPSLVFHHEVLQQVARLDVYLRQVAKSSLKRHQDARHREMLEVISSTMTSQRRERETLLQRYLVWSWRSLEFRRRSFLRVDVITPIKHTTQARVLVSKRNPDFVLSEALLARDRGWSCACYQSHSGRRLRIFFVVSKMQLIDVISEMSKEDLVGISMLRRPTAKSRAVYGTFLLLATNNTIAVIQLLLLTRAEITLDSHPGSFVIPASLAEFLGNPRILKVGINASGHSHWFDHWYGMPFNGVIDLESLSGARPAGAIPAGPPLAEPILAKISLTDMVEQHFVSPLMPRARYWDRATTTAALHSPPDLIKQANVEDITGTVYHLVERFH